jgi:hypothetical protein
MLHPLGEQRIFKTTFPMPVTERAEAIHDEATHAAGRRL